MNSVEFEIQAHVRSNGKVPFQEAMLVFGESSPALNAAVRAGLVRLKTGSNHGGKLTKHLEDNLFYLRVKKARIFFIFLKDAKIILLNGFIKDRQKTPVQEIRLARQLRMEAMA